VQVYSRPDPVRSWHELIERARVGPISGFLVTGSVVLLVVLLVLLLLVSRFARLPMGELRPRPRPRRRSLWEAFYRPYVTASTRHARQPGQPRH
jgi:hypothetical protein